MLSSQALYALYHSDDTKMIESSERGPKVLEKSNGEIIKLFREKKWFSSNRFRPYAIRFCNNAAHLIKLGFIAPCIKSLQYCPDLKTYVVHYQKLPGETVCQKIGHGNESLLLDTIAFVGLLHEKGVFFRSIHLSNLLHEENGKFALIDIANIVFRKKPLSLHMRYRNLKHLLLRREHKKLWIKFGIDRYLQYYYQSSPLSPFKKKLFSWLMQKTCKPYV